jgi:hypothetical protein
LLTLAEVAQRAGLHPGAIRKRLAEGRSDAIRIGGVWLLTDSQAQALERDMLPRKKRQTAAVRLNPEGDAGPPTQETP